MKGTLFVRLFDVLLYFLSHKIFQLKVIMYRLFVSETPFIDWNICINCQIY
jgi:hypothetical protein